MSESGYDRGTSVKKVVALSGAMLLLASCGRGHQQTNTHGHPAEPGPAQIIKLIWHPGNKSWTVIMPGNPNEQNPKSAETPLPYGVGPTMFQIDIQGGNPTTRPSFKTDGLEAWAGAKTDPHQPGITTTQILGPVVTNGGKTLVFFDLNQNDPVKLGYSLSFTDPQVPAADPIIDNGGGPSLQ